MKNNSGQVTWLAQKQLGESDDGVQGFQTFQEFLDKSQYSINGILRYEKIFGPGKESKLLPNASVSLLHVVVEVVIHKIHQHSENALNPPVFFFVFFFVLFFFQIFWKKNPQIHK